MQKYEPPYKTCPVCDSSHIAPYHHDFRDNKIYKCSQCYVQFMNPVYSDDYLSDYYAKYYSGGVDSSEVLEGQGRTNEVKLDIIQRFSSKSGRLFDFGCGNGNFMTSAREQGWQVEGYDVDCDAMEQVAKRLAAPVFCGEFITAELDTEGYDLVHAHHVVEHLKYPSRDLKKINAILKPGGLFYVAVPNIHAASARLKFFLEKIGLRKKNIGKYYDTDHHVFYYHPKSMKKLLESAGFEVLLTMNGSKSHMKKSKIVQFFTYTLTNLIYSNSAFLMIARKKRS